MAGGGSLMRANEKTAAGDIYRGLIINGEDICVSCLSVPRRRPSSNTSRWNASSEPAAPEALFRPRQKGEISQIRTTQWHRGAFCTAQPVSHLSSPRRLLRIHVFLFFCFFSSIHHDGGKVRKLRENYLLNYF